MLHGWFATGRYTSTVLFVLSMSVMLAAFWLPDMPAYVPQPMVDVPSGTVLPRVVSALIYVLAAVLLSRQTFFDRGVKWLGALYLWFVALSTFVNGNPLVAVVSLLFLISVILLFFCQYSADPTGLLYTSFMLLGVLAFITPYSLCLIPLYLLFCSMSNMFALKLVAASLLGLVTPFWLVLGTAYVFPRANLLWESFNDGVSTLFDVSFTGFTLLHILLLVFVLMVLLPAVFTFVGSASPAKPLLRRRLSFVVVADIYLLLLFGVMSGGAAIFYACQLPFVAVLAAYLFAKKESKLSNLYFVMVNAVMLAVATLSLWLIR